MSRAASKTVPSELPVFTRFYDLFLWSFERSESFPRVLRPSLTGRFQALLVEALEDLLELRYTRERPPIFRRPSRSCGCCPGPSRTAGRSRSVSTSTSTGP